MKIYNTSVRNVCIRMSEERMTKEQYMYELIDKVMTISCRDNIVVENFDLSDDEEFYVETEKQFVSCMKFYDDMKTLLDRNEIDEEIMDQELRTVLILMRQNALMALFHNLGNVLNKVNFKDSEEQLMKLKKELQTQDVDAEYLVNKVAEIRELEEKVHYMA